MKIFHFFFQMKWLAAIRTMTKLTQVGSVYHLYFGNHFIHCSEHTDKKQYTYKITSVYMTFMEFLSVKNQLLNPIDILLTVTIVPEDHIFSL